MTLAISRAVVSQPPPGSAGAMIFRSRRGHSEPASSTSLPQPAMSIRADDPRQDPPPEHAGCVPLPPARQTRAGNAGGAAAVLQGTMPLLHPIAGGLLASLALAASAEAAAPQVGIRVQERTLIVDGTSRADAIAFRVSPANPTQVAVDGDGDGKAELRARRDRFDRIVVLAGDGRDSVEVTGTLAFTEPITLEGGDGADTLQGARGAETFVGGAGNDVVTGGAGPDVAFLGAGDDRFRWGPGDGSDVVEGQTGDDGLTVDGAGAAERFDVAPAGRRLRLTRDVGAVELDLAGLEDVRIDALGGADQIALDGTGGEDRVTVGGGARVATVDGLPAAVRIRSPEAGDALTVSTLGGDDTVDATALRAGALRLIADAGPGRDDVFGSPGDDLLLGGDGGDLVDPNRGADVALLGEQADTFRWDPGDGSDTVEGQGGRDTLVLNGGVANERLVVTANGSRARVTRNVGAVELDLGDVEQLDANPLGGEDTLRIEDLSGTSLTSVVADLAADRLIDSVVVKGTSAADPLGLNGGTARSTSPASPRRCSSPGRRAATRCR